ncbi:MAG TPA: hypothetical protein VN154_06050, partial [Rhizomicrobium sp.]|nr:hypothetical protein [Rhizomicrobium sp.]
MDAWLERARRVGAWIAGAILLAAIAFLFILDTPPGHALIGFAIARLSAGDVIVDGIGGSLPGHVTAQRVAIGGRAEPWIRLHDVQIDWSPLALLHRRVVIERVRAQDVEVLRRPNQASNENEKPYEIDIGGFAL